MSLMGLIKWAELGLKKELGRSEWGSEPDEELCRRRMSGVPMMQTGRGGVVRHILRREGRGFWSG